MVPSGIRYSNQFLKTKLFDFTASQIMAIRKTFSYRAMLHRIEDERLNGFCTDEDGTVTDQPIVAA